MIEVWAGSKANSVSRSRQGWIAGIRLSACVLRPENERPGSCGLCRADRKIGGAVR